MATFNYQGLGYWKIYLASDAIMLHEDELKEILEEVESNYDINVSSARSQDLSEENQELNQALDFIEDKVGNIEELIDDEETEPHHLIRELEAIKDCMRKAR